MTTVLDQKLRVYFDYSGCPLPENLQDEAGLSDPKHAYGLRLDGEDRDWTVVEVYKMFAGADGPKSNQLLLSSLVNASKGVSDIFATEEGFYFVTDTDLGVSHHFEEKLQETGAVDLILSAQGERERLVGERRLAVAIDDSGATLLVNGAGDFAVLLQPASDAMTAIENQFDDIAASPELSAVAGEEVIAGFRPPAPRPN